MHNRYRFVKALILLAAAVFLSACALAKRENPVIIKTSVVDFDEFGDAHLDAENESLNYGDSVNIDFSGGVFLKDIPFYPAYYGRRGDFVLTDYHAHYEIAGVSCSFLDRNPCEKGEKVTITLRERGKYAEEFAAYNVPLDRTKWEGQSDAAFLNARMIHCGRIKEGILYRGSSPFDPKYNRIELMDRYIQDHGIRCILSLSSSQSDLTDRTDLSPHIREMIDHGQVIPAKIGTEYNLKSNQEILGGHLKTMLTMPGPYLIHCSFGRDRTGAVCALLESLCGADYEEIKEDFMESFFLLNNVSRDPSSRQYRLFEYKFTDTLCEMFDLREDELKTADLEACAVAYLRSCGLSDEEIRELRNLLEAA